MLQCWQVGSTNRGGAGVLRPQGLAGKEVVFADNSRKARTACCM